MRLLVHCRSPSGHPGHQAQCWHLTHSPSCLLRKEGALLSSLRPSSSRCPWGPSFSWGSVPAKSLCQPPGRVWGSVGGGGEMGPAVPVGCQTPRCLVRPPRPTQIQQLPTPSTWATCQPAVPSEGHTGRPTDPHSHPGPSILCLPSPICLPHQLAETRSSPLASPQPPTLLTLAPLGPQDPPTAQPGPRWAWGVWIKTGVSPQGQAWGCASDLASCSPLADSPA